jgi:hypothetical protein
MGLVATTGVRDQVVERPPVLHVRREAKGLPSQKSRSRVLHRPLRASSAWLRRTRHTWAPSTSG